MSVKNTIMENSTTTMKPKESNLIKFVLTDELWNLADADLVRPPSSKTVLSSSLIVSSPNSTRLLSEWLQIESQSSVTANIEVNNSKE